MVLFGELSKKGGTAHVSLDKAKDKLLVEAEIEEAEPAEASWEDRALAVQPGAVSGSRR